MTKYLFLGGPLDGQRVAVPSDAPYYRHVVAPEINFATICDPAEPQFSYYTYQKYRISQEEWVFWYADGGIVHPATLLVRKYPDPTANDELKHVLQELDDMLPSVYLGTFDRYHLTALRNKLYQILHEPNSTIP